MIRNESDYQEALRRLTQDQEVAARQRAALEDEGLTPEEVERAMAPLLSFQAQLAEEADWYERVRRRDRHPHRPPPAPEGGAWRTSETRPRRSSGMPR